MRGALVAALAALSLVGCSKKLAEAPSDAKFEARLASIRQMGPAKAAESSAQASYDFERPLMAFAKLDERLGGEQAANAALVGLLSAYKAKMAVASDAAPKLIRASYEAEIIDGLGALGAGYMAGASAMSVYGSSEVGDGFHYDSNGVKVDGSFENGKATITTEMDAKFGDLTGRATSKSVADVCSGPDGRVHITFETVSALSDGAGTGANTKVVVDVDRYYDDDARLTKRTDWTGNVQQSAFEGGQGGYVDVSHKGSGSNGAATVNSRNAAATDAHVTSTSAYVDVAVAFASSILEEASRRVEKGYCVDLKASTEPEKRSGAQPSTDYTITAMPRAKMDGAVASGMVTAALTGDGVLANPGAKVQADAQFKYKGPAKIGGKGVVQMESRSKRGVGKASLDFDTRQGGWRTTSGGAYWPPGVICDPSKPFSFSGEGTTLTFTPTGAAGGTYTLQTRLGYLNLDGGGAYTLSIDDAAQTGTLTTSGDMNMVVPGAGSKRAPLHWAYPLVPEPGACK